MAIVLTLPVETGPMAQIGMEFATVVGWLPVEVADFISEHTNKVRIASLFWAFQCA